MTGPELPAFGPDPTRIAGYTEPGHEVCARVFLPLEISGTERYRPWSQAARQAGIPLSPTLTGYTLLSAGTGGTPRWELPSGILDIATAQALVRALTRDSTAGHEARFAVWEGYGGDIDPALHDVSAPIPATGQCYLQDGSFHLVHQDLAWLLPRLHPHRAPVAFWTADRRVVLAGPLYLDSYYLSGDRATLIALREAGLEVLELDRDTPLPAVEPWDPSPEGTNHEP